MAESTSGAIRAGRAFVEIFASTAKLMGGLKVVEARLRTFGRFVGKMGRGLLLLGGAIAAPFLLAGRELLRLNKNLPAVKNLTAAWEEFKAALADAVAPLIAEVATEMAGLLKQATAWIKQNKGLVISLVKIGAVLAVVGAGVAAVGAAFILAGAAIQVFAGILTTVRVLMSAVSLVTTALSSPLLALGAAVAVGVALGAALAYATGTLQVLAEGLRNFGTNFAARWRQTIGGVIDSLLSGNVQLAMQVFWAGLNLEWAKGIAELKFAWIDLLTFLQNVLLQGVKGMAKDALGLLGKILKNSAFGLLFETAGIDPEKVAADLQKTLDEIDALNPIDFTKARETIQGEVNAARGELNRLLQEAKDRKKNNNLGSGAGKFGGGQLGTFNPFEIGSLFSTPIKQLVAGQKVTNKHLADLRGDVQKIEGVALV